MSSYNINVHSYYSLLDSIISIDDIIEKSKELNLDYAFLTDKNLYGAIEFYNKCKENNIKPIIGLEVKLQNCTLILIAKNYFGFKNLIKVSSFVETNKQFNIEKYFESVFIILKDGEYSSTKHDIWTSEDLYINEVNYLKEDDYKTFLAIKSIKENKNINDLISTFNKIDFCWKENVNLSKKQEKNFNKIIDSCDLRFDNLNSNKLPKYNSEKDSKNYLLKLSINGLLEKLNINDNKIPKKYYDRLIHELDVIDQLGYNDYFLIVADFVNFAKKNEIIIGPGRGSSAGSLVSFALNITEVDPIKNKLIFERFLNIDRKSMPDIDIDVMDVKRDELIEYIFEKYKKENTCQIITFQRIKHKMAVRDVGRVMGIPLNIVDAISKKIPNNLNTNIVDYALENKELKIYYDSYKELFEISNKLYNIPRQFSTHAAGIIIANENIDNIIPITNSNNQYNLSQWSMEYLEMFGLNKIDILGLKNLTIIYDTLNTIKNRNNKEIILDKIPLDDRKVFDELKKGNTSGIFQLESPGMRSTLIKIKPKCLEDISITSALFRPGPQQMINDFVKARENPNKAKYLNNKMEEILKDTNGFCIYQEQVIEIIKEVTKFSTSKADIYRRAISKKKIELFDQMKEEFINSALTNNYSKHEAIKIYDMLIEFANYGFNHSHSLAYSLISYWMMYLKIYYPLEFMISILKNESNSNLKENTYISEIKKMGIQLLNVDIVNSEDNFKLFNNSILIGFNSIKGFGTEIIKKIIDIRKKNQFDNWEKIISILSKNNISNRNIEILIKVGAFDKFNIERNFLLTNLEKIIKKNLAIDPLTNTPIFDVNYEKVDIMNNEEKEKYELEYLGYSFSNNKELIMFNKFKGEFNLKTINSINNDGEYNHLIYVNKIRKTITKNNKEMAFLNINECGLNYDIASFSKSIFNELEIQNFYIVKFKFKNSKCDIIQVIKKIIWNQ